MRLGYIAQGLLYSIDWRAGSWSIAAIGGQAGAEASVASLPESDALSALRGPRKVFVDTRAGGGYIRRTTSAGLVRDAYGATSNQPWISRCLGSTA